jgi:hypothetical protein
MGCTGRMSMTHGPDLNRTQNVDSVRKQLRTLDLGEADCVPCPSRTSTMARSKKTGRSKAAPKPQQQQEEHPVASSSSSVESQVHDLLGWSFLRFLVPLSCAD